MHAIRQNRSRARSTARDKVSNGRLLTRDVDVRSAAGRRYKFLVEAYAAEIGGELSQADWTLVRQAASLMLAAERLSGDIVKAPRSIPTA